MQKRITLRVLYVVMAIITLAVIAIALLDLANSSYNELSTDDSISYLALLVMLYFTIADFIQLFIKKKEGRLYTDADFEATDQGS